MANEDSSIPSIKQPVTTTISEEGQTIDPLKQSDQELLAKYPKGLKPKSVAQRKISSGGMQYFDSGDYNAASRKDKPRIKNLPVALNPALSRVRGGKPHDTGPSKLAGPPTSGLAATTVTRSEQ